MNKEEKITREFFEKFGANTIWVVPSKENVETILDIHQFLLKTLKSQREEIVEEIEKESGIAVTLNNDILLSKERIINLIKEDE